jgi:hypothetical protein
MTALIDELLPTAKEVQRRAAEKEAEMARELKQRSEIAAKERAAKVAELRKPSGMSEEDKIKLAANAINRAVANGLTEVQVYRFPNLLCTDRGRAINQQEPGWEKTLTGLPKEIYQLWLDHLQPRGYDIRYQIIDFPGGMPGDVAVIVSWKEQTPTA